MLEKWFNHEDNLESTSPFDAISKTDEQGKYWGARELGERLTYKRWSDFKPVIEKTIETLLALGFNVEDHIRLTPHMVSIGSGVSRQVEDYRLSRHGCYVITLNADASKPVVAAAKQYFATRTHQAEQAEKLLRDADRQPLIWLARVARQLRTHSTLLRQNAPGYFTIFTEVWTHLIGAEEIMHDHELPTFESDLMDGSIGKRWANYFEKETGIRNTLRLRKVVVLIGKQNKTIEPLLWEMKYIEMFRAWLLAEYFPKHLADYLRDKVSLMEYHMLTKDSVADHISKEYAFQPAQLKTSSRKILDEHNGAPITESMARRLTLEGSDGAALPRP